MNPESSLPPVASDQAPNSVPISEPNDNALEERFQTLHPSQRLPRNETLGGYIFLCNNNTMQENLDRQLFGLPSRYKDSVRAITPGLPIFLYNYHTRELHGIYKSTSFGETNIEPTAWMYNETKGESWFPAQVKITIQNECIPLEKKSFKPFLHGCRGKRFRLELTVEEALCLIDLFFGQKPIRSTR